VTLEFKPDGIEQLAAFAMQVNEQSENIGARRLHTVLERLLEEVSFAAPEEAGGVIVDAAYVRDHLAGVVGDVNLSNYVL